jgi:hypothetical protein
VCEDISRIRIGHGKLLPITRSAEFSIDEETGLPVVVADDLLAHGAVLA